MAKFVPCVIIAGLVAPGITAALAASPADKAFTIGNYPVEAIANNAVAAKDKAILDGQEAAFRSLLKRVVPVTAYNRLDRLKSVKAAEFLEGFAVRAEQNSATQYIASLDFSFQADEVRNLLNREGVPFVEVQAEPVILLPMLREAKSGADAGAAGQLRAANGSWSEVWKSLDLDNTLTPVRVEALRPIIHADTIKLLLEGDENADRILAGEYKSETIVIAVAEIDLQAKRLSVTLSGRDAVGPIAWTRSYRIAGGDSAYAMELAAVVSLGVLEGRWKSTSPVAQGLGGAISMAGPEIPIRVAFASQDEWNDIRSRLLEIEGIDDIRVGAVSTNSAEVSVRFPGGGDALSGALAPRGLSLFSVSGGWQLRSSN